MPYSLWKEIGVGIHVMNNKVTIYLDVMFHKKIS